MRSLNKNKLEIVSTSLFKYPEFTVTVALVRRTDRISNTHSVVWFEQSLTPEAIIDLIVDHKPYSERMACDQLASKPQILFTTASKARKRFWAMNSAISDHKIKFNSVCQTN